MTPWHTLGLCSALAVSILLFCGLGAAFLRILKITNLSAFDTFLFSAATGTILLELAVSAGELAPDIRTGVRIAVALAALLGLAGVRQRLPCSNKFSASCELVGDRKTARRVISAGIGAAGLRIASAGHRLGRTALSLHDASALSRGGLSRAVVSIARVFLRPEPSIDSRRARVRQRSACARLAFLGRRVGCPGHAALVQLWIGGVWPWLAALAFALTPVTFWQTTAAGAPDI